MINKSQSIMAIMGIILLLGYILTYNINTTENCIGELRLVFGYIAFYMLYVGLYLGRKYEKELRHENEI